MKQKISKLKQFKKIVVWVVMRVLGRAIQSASRWDSYVRHEVARWKDGHTVILEVLPSGPKMGLKKQGGRLKFMGSKLADADLVVRFKNIECAFLAFAGIIGNEQGFAENRMSVKGDLPEAMSLIRCMNMMVVYLYPKFISQRLVKRVPKLSIKQHAFRLYIMLIGIPTGI